MDHFPFDLHVELHDGLRWLVVIYIYFVTLVHLLNFFISPHDHVIAVISLSWFIDSNYRWLCLNP